LADVPIIEVENLKKFYKDVKAVDGISFQVFPGELFGFLGPNGAGKTTTIKLLTGLARATEGKLMISGIDITKNPKKAQHMIGVVPDESNLYPELSGFDNLVFCASLYGMRKSESQTRANELLKMFNLAEAGHRKFAGYSKGMKRKLTIAAGLIHHPQIVFLDEPTTGIDVASARQIRQLIAELHSEGITIFLTTHYIEEAERLCQRIAFIGKGKIIRVDKTSDLLQSIKDDHIMLVTMDQLPNGIVEMAREEFRNYQVEPSGNDQLRILAKQPIHVSPMIEFLEGQGAEVLEALRVRPSLEEIFVKITGLELSEMNNGNQKKAGGL
jgi:ABC-2 type transport system ATP-binding protein